MFEIEWHPNWPSDWAAPKRESAARRLTERLAEGRLYLDGRRLRVVSAEPTYALGKDEHNAAKEVILLRLELM